MLSSILKASLEITALVGLMMLVIEYVNVTSPRELAVVIHPTVSRSKPFRTWTA